MCQADERESLLVIVKKVIKKSYKMKESGFNDKKEETMSLCDRTEDYEILSEEIIDGFKSQN